MLRSFVEILDKARGLPTKRVAIASAHDPEVVELAHELQGEGIAEPILIGRKKGIQAACESLGLSIKDFTVVEEEEDLKAAERAVGFVHAKEADIVMKGLLHTAAFLKAVLDRDQGLRTDRLLSEITIAEAKKLGKILFITDCAINIAPDLHKKVQIIENAIKEFKIISGQEPKVALLAALEVVNPDMPETVDAAVICKMAERGQIRGAQIDGPLALDNIVSVEAAAHKGIESAVAGHADIIIAPDLKTGNVLHKAIVYLAGYRVASIISGTSSPIVMTSRSDTLESKLLSVALASISCEIGK